MKFSPGLAAAFLICCAACAEPASQPVSSKPVEKHGLQVTVTADKAVVIEGEAVTLQIEFKNASAKPLGMSTETGGWEWRFAAAAEDAAWDLRPCFAEARFVAFGSLKPGHSHRASIEIDPLKGQYVFGLAGEQKKPVPSRASLPVGRYRVAIAMALWPRGERPAATQPARLVTNPVEFEVIGPFDIKCRKKDDAVAVGLQNGAAVLTVTSPGGIGGATIERRGEQWPRELVLRLHLRGLESLILSCGDVKLAASVNSTNNTRNAPRLHVFSNGNEGPELGRDSPYWSEIQVIDELGRSRLGLPDRDGHFRMAVPKALLDPKAKSLVIEWIDLCRG